MSQLSHFHQENTWAFMPQSHASSQNVITHGHHRYSSACKMQAVAAVPLPPFPPQVFQRMDILLRREPGLCATLDMGVMWELSNLCLLDSVKALHAVDAFEAGNPGRIQNPSAFFSKIISNIR